MYGNVWNLPSCSTIFCLTFTVHLAITIVRDNFLSHMYGNFWFGRMLDNFLVNIPNHQMASW